jgi:hypothetical protein
MYDCGHNAATLVSYSGTVQSCPGYPGTMPACKRFLLLGYGDDRFRRNGRQTDMTRQPNY